jgi:hypothetical protein
MWSVGIVFAYFLSYEMLFINEIEDSYKRKDDLLVQIFKLLGYPSLDNVSGIFNSENYKEFAARMKIDANRVS